MNECARLHIGNKSRSSEYLCLRARQVVNKYDRENIYHLYN